MEKQGLVFRMSHLQGSDSLCPTCLSGKQHRHSFPKQSQWRVAQKLQLLHVDLCGPITPALNNGKRGAADLGELHTAENDLPMELWSRKRLIGTGFSGQLLLLVEVNDKQPNVLRGLMMKKLEWYPIDDIGCSEHNFTPEF
ncbi:hypothetical protein V2J09_004558 [Rumex salicifolius]